MSQAPPNPLAPGLTTNPSTMPQYNSQSSSQVPANQLPPGFSPLKQDANSNSPLPPSSVPQNNQVNNYNQSLNSSPALSQQSMLPPPHPGLQSSPVKLGNPPPNQFPPSSSPAISRSTPTNPSPIFPQQRQINNNAPPLVQSSHQNGPILPPSMPLNPQSNQYPNASSAFPPTNPSVNMITAPPTFRTQGIPASRPGPSPMTSQPNIPFSGPPSSQPYSAPSSQPAFNLPSAQQYSGPPEPGQQFSGPPVSQTVPGLQVSGLPTSQSFIRPPIAGPPFSGPPATGFQGSGQPLIGPPISRPPFVNSQAPMPVPNLGPPASNIPPYPPNPYNAQPGPVGQQMAPSVNGPSNQSGPPLSRPPMSGPPMSAPQMQRPPMSSQPQQISGVMPPPVSGLPSQPIPPPQGRTGPPMPQYGPQNGALNHRPIPTQIPQNMGQLSQQIGPPGPQQMPPMMNQVGQSQGQIGQQKQGRYPPMPETNYINQQPMPQSGPYGPQQLTNQMGQLSVTKQGFNQLWGHQMIDLLSCRQILPDYPEEPAEIKLGHHFADAPNCSPEIFRCTINRIPETNSLLQKSRLPLGILIHPFKDLNHLPVIQCTSIVRCRACRTYINPYVYFVDSKRWKCNLCYRVNDLPEEFQYDPVSKSYGDPSRRPEIKSATIEFIAPGEYMLRPPQPAVYLFLLDVSQTARDSGYLQVFCDTLKANLDQLPGDARTQVGFICYDAHIHFYLMSDGLTRPKEMTIIDIDEVFLPSPESLLVNLGERKELVKELLTVLPQRHSGPGVPSCALGAALQAAYKLMSPTGGRVTVFQTCLPNVGPGALQSREDPNARSSADVQHLNPATDLYKRLALDCSGAQVAVDLFLLNAHYADLASLSGMSKFSAGSIYHIPLFNAARHHHAAQLNRQLTRYLTRKIGFEAVMRVRCTRGISIHTFHGNFFVRSTDLLSLPNVSPDAGFGMQLSIDESLTDLQTVCFQAALLYTSSKGERRIRVHTMALPIGNSLTDVLHSADQQAIIGLLTKMAADRCLSASLVEAREALMNVGVDALSAHRLAQNLPAGASSSALHAPHSLRLLPLYLLATLKRKAFRTGISTRLDDRVMDMCQMKTLPLQQLLRLVYPDLYPIHELRDYLREEDDENDVPDPPRLHLTAERINSTGAYLLDDGETMIVYVCHLASPAFLSDTFGVTAFSQLPDEARSLPKVQSSGNALLHSFIDKLNDDRPYASNLLVLRDNSPNRQLFIERLVDDRVETSLSYYEFLQHIKLQVK